MSWARIVSEWAKYVHKEMGMLEYKQSCTSCRNSILHTTADRRGDRIVLGGDPYRDVLLSYDLACSFVLYFDLTRFRKSMSKNCLKRATCVIQLSHVRTIHLEQGDPGHIACSLHVLLKLDMVFSSDSSTMPHIMMINRIIAVFETGETSVIIVDEVLLLKGNDSSLDIVEHTIDDQAFLLQLYHRSPRSLSLVYCHQNIMIHANATNETTQKAPISIWPM